MRHGGSQRLGFAKQQRSEVTLLSVSVCMCIFSDCHFVVIIAAGVRCWPVDLDVSVLDQQLKLFVSRHSAFLSEDVRGE